MDIYERNINTAVSQVEKNHILTRASLLDLSHNITMELKIRISDKEIVSAKSCMIKVPFDVCNKTLGKVSKIVGLRIERGVTKELVNRLGKSTGCTHLVELAVAACRISSNVILGLSSGSKEWRERKLPDEVFRQRAMPFLKNSCLPFKEQ